MLRRAPRLVTPLKSRTLVRPPRISVPKRNYIPYAPGLGISSEMFLYAGAIGAAATATGYLLIECVDLYLECTKKQRALKLAKRIVQQEEQELKRNKDLDILKQQFVNEYLQIRRIEGHPENTAKTQTNSTLSSRKTFVGRNSSIHISFYKRYKPKIRNHENIMLRRVPPVYVRKPVVRPVMRPKRNYCIPPYGLPTEACVALACIVIPAMMLSLDSGKSDAIEKQKARERKILEQAEEKLAVETKCAELRKKRIS